MKPSRGSLIRSSMPGRAATYRSHASSTSTACAAVEVTTATPISVLRCRSMCPVSAAARPGNFLCNSAISGLTSDRFCFSDRTSPSSTSSVSAPTYTPGPLRRGAERRSRPARRRAGRARSGSRHLPHLERLDHVADLDVAVADTDAALEALADLGGVVLE